MFSFDKKWTEHYVAHLALHSIHCLKFFKGGEAVRIVSEHLLLFSQEIWSHSNLCSSAGGNESCLPKSRYSTLRTHPQICFNIVWPLILPGPKYVHDLKQNECPSSMRDWHDMLSAVVFHRSWLALCTSTGKLHLIMIDEGQYLTECQKWCWLFQK